MVLARELLPFAENLYRRFPEEFIALGMPGLEQTFDLRPDGSRSRRISETPNEKTVEITIRRWQAPMVPPVHPGYGQQYPVPPPGPVQPGYYGAWPNQANGYPAPHQATGSPPNMPPQYNSGPGPAWGHCRQTGNASPPQPQQNGAPGGDRAVEAQMTSQLARLEAALSMMMPQIQTAVANQTQQEPPQHQTSQRQESPAASRSPGDSAKVGPGVYIVGGSKSRGETETLSPASPLRNRRNMNGLRVVPPGKVEEPNAAQEPVVKPIPQVSINTGAVRREASPTNQKEDVKKERERPKNINTVRMVPSAQDPESPRSPGRFSAWK